jgi:hypothetical protein
LSQQELHEEVAELKSSAASSDEERLAAGISTIGLQTKRLWSAVEKAHYRKAEVLQVNLHHSRAALAALCAAMRNCDVAFIHEPWTYKGEIKGGRWRTNL